MCLISFLVVFALISVAESIQSIDKSHEFLARVESIIRRPLSDESELSSTSSGSGMNQTTKWLLIGFGIVFGVILLGGIVWVVIKYKNWTPKQVRAARVRKQMDAGTERQGLVVTTAAESGSESSRM